MATNTYYSPFFPPIDGEGTKGTTIASVPTEVIQDMQGRIDDNLKSLQDILKTPVFDGVAPGKVQNLVLTTGITLDSNGNQVVALIATWNRVTDIDVGSYNLNIKENNGNYILFVTGVSTETSTTQSYQWTVRPGQSFSVQVRAVDKAGNQGPWSDIKTITSAKDTIPPAIPTGLVLTPGFQTFYLKWQNPADLDVANIFVYENTVNTFSTATKLATLNALPSQPGGYTRGGLPNGAVRYYWVVAVDSSGNSSNPSAVATGKTAGISEADIIDATLTTAKFAAGLEPPTVITKTPLPTAKSTNLIYYTPESKMYRWDTVTGSYIATVAAADIVDKLQAGQIEAGAIGVDQLAANAIVANKLVLSNRRTYSQYFDFRYRASDDRLVWDAGNIFWVNDQGVNTTTPVAAGSIVWPGAYTHIVWEKGATDLKAYPGDWQQSLNPNSVEMCQWQGGGGLVVQQGSTIIDGGRIYADTITGLQIAANTISGNEIKGQTITGDLFVTNTSLPGTISIGITGVQIGTVQTQAANPAAVVNANSTQIKPGNILISGGTSLANWISGSDATKIEGGNIAANSIIANSLRIGSRGVTTSGIDFEVRNGLLYWTAGRVEYVADNGVLTFVNISANTAGTTWPSARAYVYWTKDSATFATTTDYNLANVGSGNNMVIAVWSGGTNITATYGGTVIDASRITTGTILAANIKAFALDATVMAATNVITASAQIGNGIIGSAQIGILQVKSAQIDSLTVGTDKVAYNAAQAVQFTSTGADVALGKSVWTRILQLTINKAVDISSLDLMANIRMKSTDDIQGTFRIINTVTSAVVDSWPIWMVGAGGNFQVPVVLNNIQTNWTAGAYTLAVEFFRTEQDGSMWAETGSNLKVGEIKR